MITVDERVAAYRGIRQRVRSVVESAEADALDRRCPATPDWRARDILAHLVGVPADILAGRLDGVGTDAWTEAHVAARRDVPVATMLDQWDADGPQVEALMPVIPVDRLGQMIFDATTHEHDLRYGVGRPGAQDSDAVVQSFTWVVDVGWRDRTPALRLHTEAGVIVAGTGPPAATVTVSRFDFLRASTGRRSAEQIAALDWHGDPWAPEQVLLAPIFSLAAVALV